MKKENPYLEPERAARRSVVILFICGSLAGWALLTFGDWIGENEHRYILSENIMKAVIFSMPFLMTAAYVITVRGSGCVFLKRKTGFLTKVFRIIQEALTFFCIGAALRADCWIVRQRFDWLDGIEYVIFGPVFTFGSLIGFIIADAGFRKCGKSTDEKPVPQKENE